MRRRAPRQPCRFPRGTVSHVERGQTEARRCSGTGRVWHEGRVDVPRRGHPRACSTSCPQLGASRVLPRRSPGCCWPGHSGIPPCGAAGAGGLECSMGMLGFNYSSRCDPALARCIPNSASLIHRLLPAKLDRGVWSAPISSFLPKSNEPALKKY